MDITKNDMPTKSLASAIILRAVEDYKAIINGVEFQPHQKLNKQELERFFKSMWFEDLCNVVKINKRAILEQLEKWEKKAREKVRQ